MHDIVEEARRRAPDIANLRQLNIALRESGVALIDVVRGCPILRRLDELGVGLDKVDEYVKFSEKIALEKGAGSEALVDSGLQLSSLTKETGKTYGEILVEYEKKVSELSMLNDERTRLEGEVQGAKHELVKTVEGVSTKSQELRSLISTKERLEKLGLEKIDQLALFIEGYEELGFSVEEVQLLSGWKASLALMGVDPDGLGRFIEEKGPLEAQILRMRREAKEEERELDSMRAESRKMAKEVGSLQGTVSKLSRLGIVLEKRKAFITCKICGYESALVDVPSRPVVMNAVSAGLVCSAQCARCGQWAQYSALDICAGIGLLALPES